MLFSRMIILEYREISKSNKNFFSKNQKSELTWMLSFNRSHYISCLILTLALMFQLAKVKIFGMPNIWNAQFFERHYFIVFSIYNNFQMAIFTICPVNEYDKNKCEALPEEEALRIKQIQVISIKRCSLNVLQVWSNYEENLGWQNLSVVLKH